jgi:hypothetical protein
VSEHWTEALEGGRLRLSPMVQFEILLTASPRT